MTLLNESVDSKKFDVRIVERNVDRGVIRPEDVKKAVEALQDDSANAEWVSIEALAESEDGNLDKDQVVSHH